jgi:CheY-like chemotaxis protein
MGGAMATVLIVDDHPTIRKALRDFFEQSHLAQCYEAVNGVDALQKAQLWKPDLVILDFSMPMMNGVEAAKSLKQMMPEVPVFILTAHSSVFHYLVRETGICDNFFSKDDAGPMIDQASNVLGHLNNRPCCPD